MVDLTKLGESSNGVVHGVGYPLLSSSLSSYFCNYDYRTVELWLDWNELTGMIPARIGVMNNLGAHTLQYIIWLCDKFYVSVEILTEVTALCCKKIFDARQQLYDRYHSKRHSPPVESE